LTQNLGLAALGAVATLTIFGADLSDAIAQDAAEQATSSAQTASFDLAQPVEFVSNEVVQDLSMIEDQETARDHDDQADEPVAASLRQLINEIDSDRPLSRQMRCLAGAVFFEARGEPIAGQLAVAQVIINRAESSRFPDDYCSVVLQRAQFSFVRGGSLPPIPRKSKAWAGAKAVARVAHEGLWSSKVGDALYFHAHYVRPGWSHRLQRRATIARHIFYR